MKSKKSSNTSNKILVVVRIRPLLQKEKSKKELHIINNDEKLIVPNPHNIITFILFKIVLDPREVRSEQQNKKITDVLHRSKEQRFAYDYVFKNQTSEQQGTQIYDFTCRGLISPIMKGYNACVFAYGPTGSGKTYTMLGNNKIKGLVELTVKDIINQINNDNTRKYEVKVSYVEIYNENIKDLLVPLSNNYLELRDHPSKGIVIAGVTELKVEKEQKILNLLQIGNRRRRTESTNANKTSSRSHAVFQITVSSIPSSKGTHFSKLEGKLSLIDLAGSERGTVTENRGIRLREGAKINTSLLSLANCINALGDRRKKGTYIPYRDSKLTRMLKDSLGGNSKTVMIANISPAGSFIEETLNTLKYASRAKNIKIKAKANKKLVSLHIKEYKNIIQDLQQEIKGLKEQVSQSTTQRIVGDFSHQVEEEEEKENTQEQEKSNTKNKEKCPCVCGRQQDEKEMKIIQADLFENFQQRIQLRRALMEIEEQNALNFIEIRKRQADINMWKDEQQNKAGEFPNHIQHEFKNIQTLKHSTDQNAMKREMMNLQLKENIKNAKLIRQQIPIKVKYKDKRDFLEVIIKNHILELQNLELELHLTIQEKTINDLKKIIDNQNSMISQYKVLQPDQLHPQLHQSFDSMDSNPDIQLEIEMSKSVEEDELNIRDQDFEVKEFDKIYSFPTTTHILPFLEQQREFHKGGNFKKKIIPKLPKKEEPVQLSINGTNPLLKHKNQTKVKNKKLSNKLPRLANIYGIKKVKKR